MTDYKINGSSTSIGPVSVKWIPNTQGISLGGRAIFSSYHNIEMQFNGGSIPHVRQWLDNISATSFNLTTLARDQLAFVDLSGVNAEISQWPQIEDVNYGDFTVIIRGAL